MILNKSITALSIALLMAASAVAGQKAPAAKKAPAKTGSKLVPTPPAVGAPRPFTLPPIQERTLSNGLRVLFIENHKQPTVSMNLMVKSGAAAEPATRAGLAQLTAALLTKGTATRSAQQIAEEIDSAGGSLGASTTWDATNASTTVLSNRAELAATLLADIAIRPAFTAEEVERERGQRLSGLQVSLADAGFVADQVFAKVVYGASPYAHPLGGTPETLGALTRDDIVAFHKAYFVPSNAILAIVGDLKPADAFALAEKNFGSWAEGAIPPGALRTKEPLTGKLRIIVLDKPDSAQTEIRAGHLGIDRSDPLYPQAVVANAIFGGVPFSSRIEQELRVKRGLTYGAGSRFDSRGLGGTFQIVTNTKTATTAEAVKVILDEVTRLRSGDITAEELKARKDFLTGVFALSLETPDAVAGRLLTAELYGLGKDYLNTYTQKLSAVSSDDVRKFIDARIKPDQFVIVLAGNASAFEEQIKAYGPVEKVPFAEVDPTAEGLRRVKATGGPAASPEEAKAGAELVAKTIQALGGDKFVNQKSQVLKGSGSISPAPGQTFPLNQVTDYRVYPNSSRTDFDAGYVKIRNGYNGTVGWGERPGQGIVDTTAEMKVSESFGLNTLRRFGAGGWIARPLADAEVNGKAAKGFSVVDAEGHETKFYVDPATFLPVQVVQMVASGERTTIYSDYRDVSGVKIPFGTELLVKTQRITLTFTEAVVDGEVDPALFEKPAN